MKRARSICIFSAGRVPLLILGILLALNTLLILSSADAYLPPPERVLAKSTKTIPPGSLLEASGKLQLSHPDVPAGLVLYLRVFLSPPGKARFEFFSPSYSEGVTVIAIHSNLLLATRKSEIPKLLGQDFFALLPLLIDPLMNGNTRLLRDNLRNLGVNTEQTGLEHIEKEILYRIGGPDPGEPKYLLRKENYSPRRLQLKREKSYTIDYLEFRLLENQAFFPAEITIRSGENPWIKMRFESVFLSRSPSPQLFTLEK